MGLNLFSDSKREGRKLPMMSPESINENMAITTTAELPARNVFLNLKRTDTLVLVRKGASGEKIKSGIDWLKLNARDNKKRHLKETGSELLRKMRDGVIKE